VQAGKAATLPRKILVVAQVSCSIALIISTLLVYRQIQYVRDRPTGYNLNRLMQTDLNEDLLQHYAPLKNELLQSGLAESVTTASSPATDIYWHTGLDNWPGKSPGQTLVLGAVKVSEDYFTCMGMSLAKGRYFTGNAAADSEHIILNETAVERLHLKQPINQSVAWNGRTFRIVGVIRDALILSPFKRPEPTMFLYNPGGASFVLYRLSPSVKTQDAIVKLTALFAKYNPAYPYIYQFADDSYALKFSLEVLIGKLAAVFAGLAIFVSCLGLFGLAAYIAEQRTKEIGIRKVLGASVSQVWLLLSREFVVLVLMSCVIASPLALYFLKTWLRKYDYRITIGPGVFILAGVTALLITVITISSQAIKAAVANPVKSLRAE
jgi:putative ABC transport system permease protein